MAKKKPTPKRTARAVAKPSPKPAKRKPAPAPAKRKPAPAPSKKRNAPLPALPPARKLTKAEAFLPPKIKAFKYGTKNKTDAAYRNRLKVLKDKFGVDTKIRATAKLTPQRKAAITRLTTKYSGYLNPDNRFRFVKTDKRTRKAALKSGTVNRDQTTRKGVFVQTPKGAKSKVRIRKTGELEVTTGKRKSTFATFKTTDVLKNPKKIIAEMKRRGAKRAFVSVKGFRSRTVKSGFTPKLFLAYLTGRILTFNAGVKSQSKSGKGVFASKITVEFVGGKGGFKK